MNLTSPTTTISLNAIEKRIQEKLLAVFSSNPSTSNSLLQEAMVYSVLNGGKRLRPLFVYATGLSFGATPESLDAAAVAVELIHCYSLIHDDLPAMDDDDLRRGKPSCHKAFDEATAILAGDALQSLAFEILAKTNPSLTDQQQLKIMCCLTQASGVRGMAGGQSLDLLSERKAINLQALENIHQLKTGALIRSSILMGAIAANMNDKNIVSPLTQFADAIGLAFQIQDDILDVEGTTEKLGKKAGSDAAHHKPTFPTLIGLRPAKHKMNQLYQTALQQLQSIDADLHLLQALCSKMMGRQA